ncbi:hypothetical protein CHS0354_025231 [Potamilus streckersoni]|uniref:2',5'-phosphodiesterase 12 n=1 Tax=Potamilus streckersoni TaxID=2493646 RepID=A0AAE0W5P9_9BIVA|nr:hypothetical protein CHS0354_025231 [Potamilus streckersoni]
MAKLSVRCVPEDEKIQISFEYGHNGGKARIYNSERLKIEELGRTLARIEANIRKFVEKKKKHKPNSDQPSSEPENGEQLVLELYHSLQKVGDEILVKDAFTDGAVFKICSTEFIVECNPPTVTSIDLPKSIMAGFPAMPKLQYEFTNLVDCKFSWSRLKMNSSSGKGGSKKGAEEKKSVESSLDLVELANTLMYTPTASDIGYHLKLTVTPCQGEMARHDRHLEETSKVEVTAGPEPCPFETRHLYTSVLTDKGIFRIVTYNILADLYTDQDYSRDVLYSYCPPYALEFGYRLQLLLKEIAGYNSDILCLQEVDRRVFTGDLFPSLATFGLDGYYKEKGGQVSEGTAIFFRTSKFRCIGQHDIIIKDKLETDPSCADILEKTYLYPVLKEILETRTSALQVLALESLDCTGHRLIVANTHLYFHPDASHIRLIQGIVALRHVQEVLDIYRKKDEESKVCLVFCGDFNTCPRGGMYEYFTTKQINEDHIDWQNAPEDQRVPKMNVTHNLDLASACGNVPYTNYVKNFNAMLDHIFYDLNTLEVERVIPQPEHEEVIQHTALPSVVFPSDHIAQICELKWKS